jgi:hypothetical protein
MSQLQTDHEANGGLSSDHDDIVIEPVSIEETKAVPAVLRIAVLLGTGLVIVQALYLLFVAYTGLSLTKVETTVKAGPLNRIGISVSSHVTIQNGLALVLAAVLLAAPAVARESRASFWATRTISLVAIQVLGVLLFVGSILAVRATIFFLPPLSHHLRNSQRWELISYVIGTGGTALLALAAAVATLPRFLTPSRQS